MIAKTIDFDRAILEELASINENLSTNDYNELLEVSTRLMAGFIACRMPLEYSAIVAMSVDIAQALIAEVQKREDERLLHELHRAQEKAQEDPPPDPRVM